MGYLKKYGKELLLGAVILACLILIVCTILLLVEYSTELEQQAKIKVELYAEDTAHLLERNMDRYRNRADLAARYAAESYGSREDMERRLMDLSIMPEFADVRYIRYFHGEAEYDSYNFTIELPEEDPKILALRGKTVPCASDVFYDKDSGQNYVGFYAPVTGSAFADGVVLIYPLSVLKTFAADADADMLAVSDFVSFCSSSGEVYHVLHRNEGVPEEHDNVFSIVRSRTNNNDVEEQLRRLVETGNSGVLPIKIGATSYVLSVGGAGENGGGFCVVGLYLAEKVYSSGYEFINTILGTLVIFFVLMIAFAAYFLASRRQINKHINEIGMTDQRLDCPTRLKFEKVSEEVLSHHRATNFAVIVAEMRHYKYAKDTFGEQAADQALAYLKMIFSRSLQIDETYGYIGDGCFALLLHYRDRNVLVSRLTTMNAVAGKYKGMQRAKSNFAMKLEYGIFDAGLDSGVPPHEMIDHAIEAKDAVARVEELGQYKFYSEQIRTSYIQNADIELRMDAALADGEFRVFYQPKYGIAKNRPDSAEALVRWYDAETDGYRSPGLFLPLFEANGFVVKLDHYVYIRVCEYVKECADLGKPLYPISVNVSRVTAVQSDFVDFYIRTKQKYGIADRFLTLEFTESFAYENYEVMSDIINRLHKGGFLCSIDDFGSGYSSYNILKVLMMDEIKLDKFFIEKGVNAQRDDKILGSVIDVAKSLGMKVTQEGVETRDDLERLRSLGCDVVQGYYYSKPLAGVDYEMFLLTGGRLQQ